MQLCITVGGILVSLLPFKGEMKSISISFLFICSLLFFWHNALSNTRHGFPEPFITDYGILHNCGLEYIIGEYPINPLNSPNFGDIIEDLYSYARNSCEMPALTTGQLDSIISIVENSPIGSNYPDEFVTALIAYAINEHPEYEELLSKYNTLWGLVGSEESTSTIKNYYENEILHGEWSDLEEIAVAAADDVYEDSKSFWESGESLKPEPVSDMIGQAVFTLLAVELGPFAGLAGVIGGIIVSYAVAGLVDNWGTW
ncbi:MAG: hypothetical protein R3C61_04185 [Bacteroidia bacterium]